MVLFCRQTDRLFSQIRVFLLWKKNNLPPHPQLFKIRMSLVFLLQPIFPHYSIQYKYSVLGSLTIFGNYQVQICSVKGLHPCKLNLLGFLQTDEAKKSPDHFFLFCYCTCLVELSLHSLCFIWEKVSKYLCSFSY